MVRYAVCGGWALSEKTLGQRRAAHALAKIESLKGKNIGKFDRYVERLPATIVMNGLGQAMAFELAAARLGNSKRTVDLDAHKMLYDTVESWLRVCGICPNGKDLMNTIIDSRQEEYVRAQAEALAYLDWLKMFTQAYLKGD